MNIIDSATMLVRGRVKYVARAVNALAKGKITPDMVTWVGVIAHIPIAYLITIDAFVLAAILLLFFGLFDTLDGELARLQGTARVGGMVLDATTDRVKETMIFAAIAANFVQHAEPAYAIAVVVLACGFSITTTYLKAKAEVAMAVIKRQTDFHALNRKLTDGILQFEIRIVVLILGLLINQLLVACVVIACLTAVTIVARLATIDKIIKENA